MTWIKELCQDDSRRLSSARAISLMAGFALSISTLLLTIGAFIKPEMLAPLTAFGPSLAGLAAANYGINRFTTKDGKSE